MRGFFDDESSEDSFEKRCAVELYDSLVQKRKLMRRSENKKTTIQKWSSEFQKLQRNGYTPEQIKSVLDGYIIHIGQPFVPHAYSARSFRIKYSQIERVLKQRGGLKSEIEIEDIVYLIHTRNSLRWPKDEKKNELQFIQISLNNYKSMLMALSKLQDSFAIYLLDKLPPPSHFVEQWLLSIHRLAWQWREWQGNLLSNVFRYDNNWFHKQISQMAQEYSGSPFRWTSICNQLKEQMESK